jgi:hypothetical protein
MEELATADEPLLHACTLCSICTAVPIRWSAELPPPARAVATLLVSSLLRYTHIHTHTHTYTRTHIHTHVCDTHTHTRQHTTHTHTYNQHTHTHMFLLLTEHALISSRDTIGLTPLCVPTLTPLYVSRRGSRHSVSLVSSPDFALILKYMNSGAVHSVCMYPVYSFIHQERAPVHRDTTEIVIAASSCLLLSLAGVPMGI